MEHWDDFQPGDVIVEPSGYTRVVRFVELGVLALQTVILAGGGTAKVLPVEPYPGGLPDDYRVLRNGVTVHGSGAATPEQLSPKVKEAIAEWHRKWPNNVRLLHAIFGDEDPPA